MDNKKYTGEKIKDFIRKKISEVKESKKETVIKTAMDIKERKKVLTIKQALALAVSCTIAGIPIGAKIGNVQIRHDKKNIGKSDTCDVKKGEILNAEISDEDDEYAKVFYNNEEIGKIDLNVADIYVPFNLLTNVNLRSGASLLDESVEYMDSDETVYVNYNDSAIYNYDDQYNWKKAIYEKDGTKYSGFVACEDNLMVRNNNEDKVILELNTDAKIVELNKQNKEQFEKRADMEDIASNLENQNSNTVVLPDDQIYESAVYAQIQDKTPDREVVYGYKDVKISDEDVKKVSNFLKSWENQGLYNYLTGYNNDYYGNEYVNKCITEDRKNYICYLDGLGYYGDNGAKNYGFGVMINQYGQKNMNHVDILEKKYGYDLNDQALLQIGVSKMPVKVIDEAKEYYIRQRIEEVKENLKAYNIQFTKSEILALAAIGYQCGPERIPNLIENYAQYGNSKELRRNFFYYGNNPFEYANGATVQYDGVNVGRAFANWKAFHDGELIMAAGKEPVIDIKDKNERSGYDDLEIR